MRVNRDLLLVDAQLPAAPAQARLKAPFQQVNHQDDEAADEIALFCPAQALHLFGDMLDIRLAELAGA